MEIDPEQEIFELAAAVLAAGERDQARVRRRQIVLQLGAANFISQGAGIAPRQLAPTELHAGADEAIEFCGELMREIAVNLAAQTEQANARVAAIDEQMRPQSPREAERLEMDHSLRHRYLNDEIARYTAAARQLFETVAWLRPQIDPVAVRWWQREGSGLAGRVCARREPGQPPVTYVAFDQARVLLPYDSPDRWLAVIADAVAEGAEAGRVLTLFQIAREHAMPAEAARLPEYLHYRVSSELNFIGVSMQDQPADPYLAAYDPAERRILARETAD